MNKQRLFSFILTAALVVCCAVGSVSATDMNYSGELDPFSGNAVSENQAVTTTDTVQVSNGIWYDMRMGMFYYPVDSESGIFASVADGMITGRGVSVYPEEGIALSVYRDGAPLASVDLSLIDVPGEYVICNGNVEAAGSRIFAFTIVPQVHSGVRSYSLPEGFRIRQASLNGYACPFENSYIEFTEEGRYEVTYECIRTEMSYVLSFEADYSAPTLELAAVENGIAKGPVDISDAKGLPYVQITLDGEAISFTEELTQTGDYVITVADEAGNINTYPFAIGIYFDSNSIVFFAIVLLCVGGVIAYVLISKKRLKVR